MKSLPCICLLILTISIIESHSALQNHKKGDNLLTKIKEKRCARLMKKCLSSPVFEPNIITPPESSANPSELGMEMIEPTPTMNRVGMGNTESLNYVPPKTVVVSSG